MTRSDLLEMLASSALRGDRSGVRRTLLVICQEESRKGHTHVADRLTELLSAASFNESAEQPNPSIAPVDYQHSLPGDRFLRIPNLPRLSNLHLSEGHRETLKMLVLEHRYGAALRARSLEPRSRILLTGPPGTGKTSVARALAAEMELPLHTIQYEQVIGSYLGETSSRVGRVFREASAFPSVLFMDEFDTLAKERGDEQDSGEVKRVVSTLLLQIDALPSHVILIGATNHAELLDRAAWRRFQTVIAFDLPETAERLSFAEAVMARLGTMASPEVMKTVEGNGQLSYADIEEMIVAERRKNLVLQFLEDD